MNKEGHRDHLRKNYFDDFKLLRESGFWLFLSPETQEGILSLLNEHQDEVAVDEL